MSDVSRARRVLEPLAWFAALLLVWEGLVAALDVSLLVLPPPSAFLARIVEDHERFVEHGWATTRLVLAGLAVGALAGVALGYVIGRSRRCERLLYPLVVFVQGIPKITLAPLFLVWFGFSEPPKIFLTALIAFFPVLVDSAHGFRSIDPRHGWLLRSTGASRWQTFRLLQLPSAAPAIFSGLRTTVVIAVTVAIVVEWLSSKTGLGYLVLRAMDSADTVQLFATLVVGSSIGVVLSYAIVALERFALPWRRTRPAASG